MQILQPAGWKRPKGYANGVVASGRMLFVAGQVGWNAQQVFESTEMTCSNWSSEIQHGSPPLALLTKMIEESLQGSGQRIARLSLDILGAIPVAPMRVRTWVPRPGRRIALVAAEMAPQADPDRPVARVTAWALASSVSAGTCDLTSLVSGLFVIALAVCAWQVRGQTGYFDAHP